jgi:small-conductance mechanosensitive channel
MRGKRAVSRCWAGLALSVILGAFSNGLQAAPSADPEVDEPATAPVVLDGVPLFRVRGLSTLPASERARRIAERIATAASDPGLDPTAVRTAEGSAGTEIHAGPQRLFIVSDADAALEGAPRTTVAALHREATIEAIRRFRAERTPAAVRSALLATLVIAASLAAVLAMLLLLGRRLDALLEKRLHSQIRHVQIESYKLIDADLIWKALHGVLNIVRALLALAACFVALGLALRRFPATREVADNLLSYVVDPLRAMGRSAAAALPNLVFLVILVVIVRWALKAARLFFDAVGKGRVTLQAFDPTWAVPTYRLVRIVVIAFTLIVAYPYIPGSSSEAFKAISIFAGILFSLGSSSIIASIIAGYAMTYRRTFRVGDRVKIGEVVGDVEQIGLMVTRLRTPKNEEAVIPNSSILQGEVLNYSAYARNGGLILHTRAGIGYEVPWRQVEGMLLLAADRTRGILREPRPYVLQLELADFCVNYELNVYCDDAHAMPKLYTELHRNVLDVFNEHGVQIMTPAYEGDPAEPKIVPRDQWYAAPARMEAADPGAQAVAPTATSK